MWKSKGVLMNKRQVRRSHVKRIKNKRANYYGMTKMSPKQLGCVCNTPQPCSEACCGNPRKFFNEVTMQEKKSAEAFKAGLDDAHEDD